MTNKLKPTKTPIAKALTTKTLTLSQVETLHRMYTGTTFMLRKDGKAGKEIDYVRVETINAPSIPALYRKGLVKVEEDRSTTGHSVTVKLSPEGIKVLDQVYKLKLTANSSSRKLVRG